MRLPTRPRPARAAALGAAGAVAAATLAVLPGPAQAAGIDPQPGGAAAGWLRANTSGASVPDTLEAALGLKAVGDAATSAQLRDAVTSRVAGYVSPSGDDDPNATALVAWYAQQLGADATTYGGENLLSALATDVTDAGGTGTTTGRLTDASDTPVDPTPTTVSLAGQAFATAALAAGGAAHAADAANSAAYLTSLQCSAGFFKDALPAPAPAVQTCDGTPGSQSVQATALYLIAYRSVSAGAVVTNDPRDRAVKWLLAAQQNNGRWAAAGGGATGDTAATSLAAYALSLYGRGGAAAQGAIWLRGIQLANAGQCVAFPASDVGAVAPDGGAYTGVGGQQAAFRLATSRALLVLGLTPGGQAVTDNVLTLPRFARPGATLTATVRTAPRNLLCATAASGATSLLAATRVVGAYDGGADFTFPAGPEGTTTASITDPTGQVDTASTTVLGAKKLAFSFKKKKVRAGKKAVVKVRGLAPGETVRVSLRGTPKVVTVASGSGQAKVRFTVKGKRGKAKVQVTGQFEDRTRTKKLVVTRR